MSKKRKPKSPFCLICGEPLKANKELGIKRHKRCKNCTILLHDDEECDCHIDKSYFTPSIL